MRRLEHASGLVLTIEAERRVGVTRTGEKMRLSPSFAADLKTVCASEDGSIVTITTDEFITEIWNSDFSSRRGPSVDERALFGTGRIPEKTDWVAISPDGTRAMVRSSLWDPPNLEFFWISVWDIGSGLPLMDRVAFEDDGLTDGIVRSARFTPDGNITFIGDEALVPNGIELDVPATTETVLPDYAEAIAGLRINAEGVAVAVPSRSERLVQGTSLIQSVVE